jgi:YVTN family beta-propeller protein
VLFCHQHINDFVEKDMLQNRSAIAPLQSLRKPRRFVLPAIASLTIASSAFATTPVTSFNFGMAAFVENAAGTTIYAAVPDQNAVVSIDAATLQITHTLYTGLNPVALSLSLDGSKLFVANNGSTSVGVINTATFTAAAPLNLASANPLAVAPGTNNRLWVLTGHQNGFANIIQIDATTGASAGANINVPGALIYGGDLRGSLDGNALFYGDFGTSGSYLARFNVSGATATTTWSIDPGGNGEDLEISNDRSRIVLICGGGNNQATGSYSDATYSAATGALLNDFHVDAYPRTFAFSPDNLVGYAGQFIQTPSIKVFDLTTNQQLSTIDPGGNTEKLFVDNSGRYLFADLGSTTAVFATGRVAVPEPASLLLLTLPTLSLLRRPKPRHP